MSTWVGWDLDVQVTRPHRYEDCKSNDTMVTLRDEIPSIRDNGDGSRRPS